MGTFVVVLVAGFVLAALPDASLIGFAAICCLSPSRSSAATGETSFVSAQPAALPVPLTSEP